MLLGHALWVAALAYMLGGTLGMGLSLVWGCLWTAMGRAQGPGLFRRPRHGV